jgi:DNA-binding CsgD family transcriptional regulator
VPSWCRRRGAIETASPYRLGLGSRAAVLQEYATPREWQLEQLWLQGMAPKQIARLLGI